MWIITAQKWSFPSRVTSVDVTKSANSYGFCHIYWRNPKWNTSIFVPCILKKLETLETCWISHTIPMNREMKFPILTASYGLCFLQISLDQYWFPQIPVDLVTFTEEIVNGILHFLRSVFLKNLNIGNMLDFSYHSNEKERKFLILTVSYGLRFLQISLEQFGNNIGFPILHRQYRNSEI